MSSEHMEPPPFVYYDPATIAEAVDLPGRRDVRYAPIAARKRTMR
jgi:hypothetical protein